MNDNGGPISESIHATSVAVGETAALIVGPSGSGKSSLALQLIGLGAKLVSDDISRVEVRGAGPVVCSVDRMQGVIEARGVGLVNVAWQPEAPLGLVVDMSENEMERLPSSQKITKVAGFDVPLVLRVDAPYFASAIYHLLLNGRHIESS